MLRLYPAPPEELAADDVYSDLRLPVRTGRGGSPYVAINMVSTLDGRVAIGGKASPIGGGIDRRTMRNIRGAFDAVLVGVGTARSEEMNLGVPEAVSEKRKANGLPDQPLGVILAGSGELPLGRAVFRPGGGQSVAVVAGGDTPAATLEEAESLGVTVLRTGAPGRAEPRDVLRLLKDRMGVAAVLLEGGPAVNGSFLSSGMVDELFLTLSPKISLSREEAPSIATTQEPSPRSLGFDLVSLHSAPQEGELYLRYTRRPSA